MLFVLFWLMKGCLGFLRVCERRVFLSRRIARLIFARLIYLKRCFWKKFVMKCKGLLWYCLW